MSAICVLSGNSARGERAALDTILNLLSQVLALDCSEIPNLCAFAATLSADRCILAAMVSSDFEDSASWINCRSSANDHAPVLCAFNLL